MNAVSAIAKAGRGFRVLLRLSPTRAAIA